MVNKTVEEYLDCARCPNRIFNTGKYIQGGRGSIHGDIVFLFPRGDRNYCEGYQLFTDIGNLYDEYSGRNNTEDVYMTYSVKLLVLMIIILILLLLINVVIFYGKN